jgi:cytochrome d ubiquinol oxidase subunit I
LLRGRDIEFAKRSFRIAAAFGLASALSVIVLGDESGYTVGEAQQTKLAAMEAIWHTQPAPADLTLFALPNQAAQRNDDEIRIPWLLGLIGTRSLSKEIPGIVEIKQKNRLRILDGMLAVSALDALRNQTPGQAPNPALQARFARYQADLGFGLLLKKYTSDVSHASPAMIDAAVNDTVPQVAPMFWTFRMMVGLGLAMLALFLCATVYSLKGSFADKKWLLRWALYFLPLPWLSCELGWFVAEYGRQPWTIYGVLPTRLSVSTLSVGSLYGSLAGFIGFYTVLLVVEMFLMVKFAKQGPGSLATGRYANEVSQH